MNLIQLSLETKREIMRQVESMRILNVNQMLHGYKLIEHFTVKEKNKIRKHEENTRNIELGCVSKTRYNWRFYIVPSFMGTEPQL